MAEKLIISISGVRGIIGENLNISVAAEYGAAFGTFLRQKTGKKNKLSVCIGRDSRPSGAMLESAIMAGLCSVGINVIDLGIVTTPCVGVMLRHLKCDGGVIITASHNPIQYNGIKLLLDNGIAPAPEQAKQIKKYYQDKSFDLDESRDRGRINSNDRAGRIHINKVMETVDKGAIAFKKFRVVLDSVNGAGGPVTKELLKELGCEVTPINDGPTGIFAHTPEPLAENLIGLCEAVKKANAQIGFAQDPDADRLAIVDENGTYIGEEYTLALSAKYIFSRSKGSAATNLSTSRMIDDIAHKAGCNVIRTLVGEANVAKAMIENNCIIGGEGNGGIIDLRVGPVRDSLVGIALILQLMTETNKTISHLVGEIAPYYMNKDKFHAEKAQAEQILSMAKEAFSDAELNDSDGCRFDFDDGWLHLRSSNTEPVMRIIVEAKDKAAAQRYIEIVSNIHRKVMS
ncbi:MAG: phosphoglucosamine mutase [Planctomycetota bacterium]|jgi:phosphomannomutase